MNAAEVEADQSGAPTSPQGGGRQPDTWAHVELMGHVSHWGRLSEEEKFGCKLGRVDIPRGDGSFTTVYFGGQSVYRISIVTEQVARHMAPKSGTAPVSAWDFPRPALPAPEPVPAGVCAFCGSDPCACKEDYPDGHEDDERDD